MKFTLEINMRNTEGVLERILGTLRQRNCNIQAINANCTKDFSTIEARITVESKLSIEPAIKQLAKLYDVQKINAFSLDTQIESNRGYEIALNSEKIISKIGEQNAICFSL